MQSADFLKLIGATAEGARYLPVALLLRSGHACAGYYRLLVNEDLEATCVLLNTHLIELQGSLPGRPTINDFNEFLIGPDVMRGSVNCEECRLTTGRPCRRSTPR